MTSSDGGNGGVATCPNCGAPLPATLLHGGNGTAQAQAHPTMRRPHPAGSAGRWSLTDQVIGAATIMLLVALFLPWYSLTSGGTTIEASGASTHGYLWIAFAICLAVLAFLVTEMSVERLPVRLPGDRQLIIGLTGLNLILVLLAFLSKPAVVALQATSVVSASTNWAYGAFVALIVAVIAVAAAIQALMTPTTPS